MASQSIVDTWFFGPKTAPSGTKNWRAVPYYYHPLNDSPSGEADAMEEDESPPEHCAFFLLGAPTLTHVDKFVNFCREGKAQDHACHLFISADLKDLRVTDFSKFPSNFRVVHTNKQPNPDTSNLVSDPLYHLTGKRLVSPYDVPDGKPYNAEIQHEITESIHAMIEYALKEGVKVYFANVARGGRVFSFSSTEPPGTDPFPIRNDMRMLKLLNLPPEGDELNKYITKNTSAGATFMADVTVAVAATAQLLYREPHKEITGVYFEPTGLEHNTGSYFSTNAEESVANDLHVLTSHPVKPDIDNEAAIANEVKFLVVDDKTKFAELHREMLFLSTNSETCPKAFGKTYCLHDAFLNDMDDHPAVNLIKSFTSGPCIVERTFLTKQ